MDISAAERFCAILRHLGGPNIQEDDIAWANDLPAGRSLLQWMSDQMLEDSSAGHSAKYDNELFAKVSLRPITLEYEERRIYDTIQKDSPPVQATLHDTYVVPSILQKRSKTTETEVKLLELEEAQLKYRLKHAKTAIDRLQQTAKSLQTAIRQLNDDLRNYHESLSELSNTADETIPKSVLSAHQLLSARTHRGQLSFPNNVDSLQSAFDNLSTLHASIVDIAETNLRQIDGAQRNLPSLEEVEREASRVNSALSKLKDKHGHHEEEFRTEVTYTENLKALCDKLENATDPETVLSELLRSDDMHVAADLVDPFDLDIRNRLETGWKLDQMALLIAKEQLLDEAQQLFDETLIPPLRALHEIVCATNAANFEAEALIGALLEELEETVDDVEDAKHKRRTMSSVPGEENPLVYEALTKVLKDNRDLRPPDAPPLVLLDGEDLTQELKAVETRLAASTRAETKWTSELPDKLSVLSNLHAPLLSTIYANSPVNTSKPFEASLELNQLEREARREAEKLSNAIIKLQKEAELTDRSKRKLNAFVDKWGAR
ncbi:unnamed protein product [Somion occarium]|uniref:HAUS augmin-like complex subunit 3 N-terminal domain-containing protein n=1 Tax=Somion occarium TaxID=3059160 RepID=A0ABP1DUR6_9APHY